MEQHPQATVRILDEVNIAIRGLSKDHMDHLHKRYSVNAPNYFFHPKFKLGQWDGKIHYFHKTGKTFLYLIEEILPHVVKLGYTVKLEDCRNTLTANVHSIDENIFSHISHLDTGEPLKLRDYQVEAVNELIKHGYGIVVAGTGAGKTLTCAALVKAYDSQGIKSLTIVPDQTLIRQTKREYINCQLDAGEYSGTTKTLNHQHVVSTWQALKNNPKIVSMFGMVIVDECHGLKGNVLSKLLTDHAAKIPYRFGFTGTLPKEESDKLAVHVAVGPVRYTTHASELMDRGILASLQINIIQLEEDLKEEYQTFCKEVGAGATAPTYIQYKDQYFGDFAAEKSYLQRNPDRIEWIAAYLSTLRASKKGNILCLVDNIAFGRKLAENIDDAICINGKDATVNERQQVYELFNERDDLIVIATVHIAGTGLNIPRIHVLGTIDIGKSFIRVIQAIGRSLRKAEDKHAAMFIDICSDLKYSKKHVRQRINYYEEAKYSYKKQKIDYAKMLKED